jgi:hypothetical protein
MSPVQCAKAAAMDAAAIRATRRTAPWLPEGESPVAVAFALCPAVGGAPPAVAEPGARHFRAVLPKSTWKSSHQTERWL